VANPFRTIAQNWGFTHLRAAPVGVGRVSEFERERGLPPPPAEREVESLPERVAYVEACIRAIATKVAEIPFVVLDERAQEVQGHPVVELLRRPNAYYTEASLKEAIVVHLLSAGNSYLERVPPGRGRTKELWPIIPPSSVYIIPGKDEFIRGYFYRHGGKEVALEKDQVIHILLFHPRNAYYGLSPLQAVYSELITDIYAVDYNKLFFERGARPDGVIQIPQWVSEPAMKRIIKQWEEAHRGLSKAHGVAVLSGGAQYTPISLSQQDMQFLELRNFTKKQIAALFRVPPVVLGDTEGASRAGASDAREQFYHDVVIPLAKHIAQTLQKHLFTEEDRRAGYILWPDFTQVQALTATMERRARVAERLLRTGWPPNLILMRVWGLPPFLGDEGWISYVPANLAPAGYANQAVLGPSPTKLSFQERSEELPEPLQRAWERYLQLQLQLGVSQQKPEEAQEEAEA